MVAGFPITIFHNPACSSSRRTLATIEAAGYAPVVVEYLKVGWSRPQLEGLLAQLGLRPPQILREKEPAAAGLRLADPATSDDEILSAMVAHPILVNRPIVVTPKGARLCRPPELVLYLLESAAS